MYINANRFIALSINHSPVDIQGYVEDHIPRAWMHMFISYISVYSPDFACES